MSEARVVNKPGLSVSPFALTIYIRGILFIRREFGEATL